MRKIRKKQLPLPESSTGHPKVQELEKISVILDDNDSILELVAQDLGIAEQPTGANGMTAEQVLRAAIVKQTEGLSYHDLDYHLSDSRAFRQFCRLSFGQTFAKSTLHENIKSISPATWEAINRTLVLYARDKGIEQGRKARIDCTVVASNIHKPTDSELLWDSVRVLARVLQQAVDELGLQCRFMNHTRRGKRRRLEILNGKNAQQRLKPYKDLLLMTENTVGYAESALQALEGYQAVTAEQVHLCLWLRNQLRHFLPLVRQVICQTTRRVLLGESVPASDKIVSLFEPHTDIIVKDRRDTLYGHKICLTGGQSNLILDCRILTGNPADTSLTVNMLERQQELYGRPPLKVALDGGFASKENLKQAREQGIKDVCFSKGRGMNEKDMCRSRYVYRSLRKFRAGIESGISWLKRAFGLDRCLWKGFESFQSYVWASVVSANLLTMSRNLLAEM